VTNPTENKLKQLADDYTNGQIEEFTHEHYLLVVEAMFEIDQLRYELKCDQGLVEMLYKDKYEQRDLLAKWKRIAHDLYAYAGDDEVSPAVTEYKQALADAS
jgi:hypothetical protein